MDKCPLLPLRPELPPLNCAVSFAALENVLKLKIRTEKLVCFDFQSLVAP